MLIGFIDIESISQKMVLESNLESVLTVEKLISQAKEEYLISEENYNYIWIALNEAVSNAIKHGNKFNPAKKVRLTVETKEDRFLCFTIKDEGDGFDYRNVPDPTTPDLPADKTHPWRGRCPYRGQTLAIRPRSNHPPPESSASSFCLRCRCSWHWAAALSHPACCLAARSLLRRRCPAPSSRLCRAVCA